MMKYGAVRVALSLIILISLINCEEEEEGFLRTFVNLFMGRKGEFLPGHPLIRSPFEGIPATTHVKSGSHENGGPEYHRPSQFYSLMQPRPNNPLSDLMSRPSDGLGQREEVIGKTPNMYGYSYEQPIYGEMMSPISSMQYPPPIHMFSNKPTNLRVNKESAPSHPRANHVEGPLNYKRHKRGKKRPMMILIDLNDSKETIRSTLKSYLRDNNYHV